MWRVPVDDAEHAVIRRSILIIPLYAGRSGVAVMCLTAVWEDQESNREQWQVFRRNHYTALARAAHPYCSA